MAMTGSKPSQPAGAQTRKFRLLRYLRWSRQSGSNRRPADYKTGSSHGSKWLLESKLRSAAFLDKPRKPPKSRDNCNKLQWKIALWSLRRMVLPPTTTRAKNRVRNAPTSAIPKSRGCPSLEFHAPSASPKASRPTPWWDRIRQRNRKMLRFSFPIFFALLPQGGRGKVY